MAPPSSSSPISNIPYDVLLEIFHHYIQQYPFYIRWFDPTCRPLPPMVLCRVCSVWRQVALSSATLWSRLSYTFTLYEVHIKDELWRDVVIKKDIEFLKWWRRNLGSVLPYLCIGANFDFPHLTDVDPALLEGDTLDDVLKFLASAQYLHIFHGFYCTEMLKRRIACPNLHTLVLSPGEHDNDIDTNFNNAQEIMTILPSHSRTPLRRLCIKQATDFNARFIPSLWSMLTHIALYNASFDPDFWHNLVRTLPALQWGYFIIIEDLHESETHLAASANLIDYTLNDLTSLFITCNCDCDISILFRKLHLPALRTLSLGDISWEDSHTITQLDTIMLSTPNITTLILGRAMIKSQFYFNLPSYNTGESAPIWAHTPHLAHLQLELLRHYNYQIKEPEDELALYLQHLFRPGNRLLRLEDSVCPIRIVTIVDANGHLDFAEESTVQSRIREIRDNLPNIVAGVDIRVTAKSIEKEALQMLIGWSVEM